MLYASRPSANVQAVTSEDLSAFALATEDYQALVRAAVFRSPSPLRLEPGSPGPRALQFPHPP